MRQGCVAFGRAGSAHFRSFHSHTTHLRDASSCGVEEGGGKWDDILIVEGLIIISGESFIVHSYEIEADPTDQEGQG